MRNYVAVERVSNSRHDGGMLSPLTDGVRLSLFSPCICCVEVALLSRSVFPSDVVHACFFVKALMEILDTNIGVQYLYATAVAPLYQPLFLGRVC